MIYKVLYDIQTPTWTAYGRVWMGDADDAADAELSARHEAAMKYPGAIVTRVDVSTSSVAAWRAFQNRVEANRIWNLNVARGLRNDRRSL